MLRLSFLIALWTALGTTVAFPSDLKASDAESPAEVNSIQVGFGNHYKLGCWTPVTIMLSEPVGDSGTTARNAARHLDVQVADGDGVPAWFIGPDINGTESAVYEAYVRIGRANQPIHVGISTADGNGNVAPKLLAGRASESSAVALSATGQFIVELGASIGYPEMVRRQNLNEAERTSVVTIETPQPLPDEWYGYDGVDTVVIVGAAAAEKSLLSAPAIDALEQWVQQGGELVVCCGGKAEQILGANKPLSRFAPGELSGVINLPAARFGPIENFAGAEQPLESTSIRVPQWKNVAPDHRIELSGAARAEDLPLVIRWPFGFGQVTFVGLDLDRPPFAQWPSRAKFLEKLVGKRALMGGRSAGSRAAGQGKQLGYIDLAGQLRGALDQFEDVHLVPFWAVAILGLAYIVLLFPLNYWIVIRGVRRQALAWVIFASVILTFCLAAYALASYAKGKLRHVNQVDLTDVDLIAGRARGATWLNIFSAENALYDLHVEPRISNPMGGNASASADNANPNSSTLLSWFGLPGTGLGGMSSAAVNLPLFDEPYMIDPGRGTISGVPLAKWSSQSFVARWEMDRQAADSHGLNASLTATIDRRLRGTMVNRLDSPLTDCVLLFDRWAYPLGTLTPGKSVSLDRAEWQTIDTYLTKRRTIAAHDEVPPYDRAGFDVLRIMEVMMFYDAAGGSNYAGLVNRYQRFTDLTDQLEFGRAILVGRGPAGAVVQIDGRPATDEAQGVHTSMYRYVIPVESPNGT